MNITKDERKRIIEYFIVVICCLIVGIFIGIDQFDLSIKNISQIIISKNNLFYIFAITVNYWLFLSEYVIRYSLERPQKYPANVYI